MAIIWNTGLPYQILPKELNYNEFIFSYEKYKRLAQDYGHMANEYYLTKDYRQVKPSPHARTIKNFSTYIIAHYGGLNLIASDYVDITSKPHVN